MHFIRAFPIVLILVLVIGLIPVFADSDPYWLQGSTPQLVTDQTFLFKTNHQYYYFSNSDIPVYVYGFSINRESLNNIIAISYYPTTVGYSTNGTSSSLSVSNSIVVNGTKYYYSTVTSATLGSFALPVVVANSLANSIRFVYDAPGVESGNILYNISRFIFASNTWLTSIVGTVMANPLLIFILLFYFVGTAIGLLFRFRRN